MAVISDGEDRPALSKAEAKARTGKRLTEAALQLFEAQGFESTTVVQIAAAAGVIERTFFNHFPTKADVLFPSDEGAMRTLRSRIVEQPPAVSDLEALRLSCIEWLLSAPRGDMVLHRRLVRVRLQSYGSLSVVGRMVRLMTEFTSTIVASLAERHGHEQPSAEDRALGIAVAELLRVAWEEWIAGDQKGDFAQSADRYLAVLRDDGGE